MDGPATNAAKLTARHLTIGVLGGLGPHATVDFMRQIYGDPAGSEQDYVRLIVDCNPAIPSRDRMSPAVREACAAMLTGMARNLERAGADLLVMPCNTAHVFQAEIEAAVTLPFVSIVSCTVDEVERVAPTARRIGILGTRTCLEAGLYQDELARRGREAILLPEPELAAFMRLVGRVKVGGRGRHDRAGMRRLGQVLSAHGAQAIIAGCTEVGLVAGASDFAAPLVDSTAALARAALQRARR